MHVFVTVLLVFSIFSDIFNILKKKQVLKLMQFSNNPAEIPYESGWFGNFCNLGLMITSMTEIYIGDIDKGLSFVRLMIIFVIGILTLRSVYLTNKIERCKRSNPW